MPNSKPNLKPPPRPAQKAPPAPKAPAAATRFASKTAAAAAVRAAPLLDQAKLAFLESFVKKTSKQDIILTIAGVGLATSLSTIAFFQVATNDGAPNVNGGGYLEIFAQPTTMRDERLARAQPDKNDSNPSQLDYTPTATIPKNPAAEKTSLKAVPPPAKNPQSEYALRTIELGYAVFDGPEGELLAMPGMRVPGYGVIRSIVNRDGEFEIVWMKNDRPQPTAKSAQASKQR